jgi:ubiquitin carboxyl-terminal hydrolase 7
MVYIIPTSYHATTDIAWALQRTFYAMQISQVPVSTDELIPSLGCRVGEPQDAQNKAMEILYLLEQRMEAAAAGDNLKRLFEGQSCTYHYALDSNQGASIHESFWNLSLNIRPYRSLAESLRNYIQPFGVEDSDLVGRGQRGSQLHTIDRFPSVLELHLKRYEYDLKLRRMVKDDSLWEFPEEIDLDPFLSFTADKSESNIYRLFGVITHEGNLNGGVYYVYLRPTGDGPFFRFHDEKVTPASPEEVFDANFRGDSGDMYGASKTAYMLFYCRVSRLQELFADITDEDLPLSVRSMRLAHA